MTLRAIAVFAILSCCKSASYGADPDAFTFNPNYVASRLTADFSFANYATKCYTCHLNNGNNEELRKIGALDRVTMVEERIWKAEDYHGRAFEVLKTKRAQDIGLLMGLKNGVENELQCVNCHSGHYKIDARALTEGSLPKLELPATDLNSHGVSCQVCHGPGLLWSDDHQVYEKDDSSAAMMRQPWRKESHQWRNLSAETKYAQGFFDLRHPVTRAQVCLSCHLGSSREGKVVTHEMYAAGHPPLSGFEVETFAAAMPPHGFLLEDKKKKTPDSHPWYKPGDMYRTRSVLTASIVALQMQVQLIADEARWASDESVATKPVWPELALYDCASCHHELRMDKLREGTSSDFISWRQQRGYEGHVPGRPMHRSWPTALYRVAGFDDATLMPLRTAFDDRPFGDPSVIAFQATKAADKLAGQIEEFNRPITAAAAHEFLRKICDVGLDSPPAFDDARQLAWAVQIISRELNSVAPNELKDPERHAIDSALSEWKALLTLDLTDRKAADFQPDRPPDADRPPTKEDRTPLIVNKSYLDAMREYDPEKFHDSLRNLSKAIGQGSPMASTP